MRNFLLLPLAALLLPTVAHAKLSTKEVTYQHGDVTLQGYLAWDDAVEGRRPGVLIVHEWWGLNDYARKRADQLAQQGYVAFALDMYGKGKLAKHPREASQMAGAVRANVDQWRARAQAGLAILKQQSQTDTSRLAAIGYCFGGSTVLQLALAGEDLGGVVSFHGALPAPDAEEVAKIKCRVLVCHGAADNFIPPERIQQFTEAMNQGGADWEMVFYGGARHSFTNPGADQRGIDGLKYQPQADRRSWAQMETLFEEIFSE